MFRMERVAALCVYTRSVFLILLTEKLFHRSKYMTWEATVEAQKAKNEAV